MSTDGSRRLCRQQFPPLSLLRVDSNHEAEAGFLLEQGMLILCVSPTEASSWSNASGDLMLAHPEVIRCYYSDIDVTLIRENLKLTPVQRLRRLEEFVAFIKKLEGARQRTRCPR